MQLLPTPSDHSRYRLDLEEMSILFIAPQTVMIMNATIKCQEVDDKKLKKKTHKVKEDKKVSLVYS